MLSTITPPGNVPAIAEVPVRPRRTRRRGRSAAGVTAAGEPSLSADGLAPRGSPAPGHGPACPTATRPAQSSCTPRKPRPRRPRVALTRLPAVDAAPVVMRWSGSKWSRAGPGRETIVLVNIKPLWEA